MLPDQAANLLRPIAEMSVVPRVETMPLAPLVPAHLYLDGWQERVPEARRELYEHVVAEAGARGIEFALGGAFAAAVYNGRWRDTGSLDLYVLPADRDEMVEVLSVCGMRDAFDQLPYDRGWIYRGTADGVTVNLIWGMANQRANVDERWVECGPLVHFGGERLRIVPPEELIWSKIYVMQRDRCEWPDVLNLIHALGPHLDWRHLLERVADDAPLLKGVLAVFEWLSPDRAAGLPKWLWGALDRATERRLESAASHAELLDTRPWFRPTLPEAA